MRLERNTVYQGDSIKYIKDMDSDSVEMTLTDIPYGEVNRDSNGLRSLDKEEADIVTFNLADLVSELIRVTSGSIYMFCGTEQVSAIRKCMVDNGLSIRLVIWEKANPSPMNGESIYLSGVETCVYGKKKGATFNGFCENSVFRYPSTVSKIHPTQKPIGLFKKLIQMSSKEGDLIFDPFMGSGTTCIAAGELQRDWIGIELNEKWYEAAKARINDVFAQTNLFGVLPKYEPERKRVYISGKITGNSDEVNDMQFSAAAVMLRNRGYFPINPWELKRYALEYNECLSIDKILLKSCSAIYLLPGWETSNGAKTEVEWAKAWGLEFING